jgi:hypothetical protein
MQELQSDYHFKPPSDLDLRKIAVARNPDSKDTHVSSMNASQDIACIFGESFWLSVLKEPWDALGKR